MMQTLKIRRDSGTLAVARSHLGGLAGKVRGIIDAAGSLVFSNLRIRTKQACGLLVVVAWREYNPSRLINTSIRNEEIKMQLSCSRPTVRYAIAFALCAF